jgi:hypothetical protein
MPGQAKDPTQVDSIVDSIPPAKIQKGYTPCNDMPPNIYYWYSYNVLQLSLALISPFESHIHLPNSNKRAVTLMTKQLTIHPCYDSDLRSGSLCFHPACGISEMQARPWLLKCMTNQCFT